MFYDAEGYEIISERPDPEYAHMVHLDIRCSEDPKTCPLCGHPAKKHSKKERTLLDYNEEKDRVEKIVLKYRKYICKSPSCGHTFVDGLPGRASHTRSFDRYLTLSLITGDPCSLTRYGRMYGLSHTTVSDIVCGYAKELHPHFAPPSCKNSLFLHSFLYQGKERYYLGAVDDRGNHALLDFFGYEDREKEMLGYFHFHWRQDEFPHSSVSLLTDMDFESLPDLEKMFVYLWVSIEPHLLNNWLENFKKDNGNQKYNQVCMLVNRLKTLYKMSSYNVQKI